MATLRKILWYLRPFKRVRRRAYGPEVLYSGWVDLPRIKALPTSVR